MARFLFRRLAAAFFLLLFVLTAIFAVIHIAPGDPINVFLDPEMPREAQQRLREIYGLDRPLYVQYFSWLKAVVRGDWGQSLALQLPVSEIVARTLPATITLALGALFVEYALALPLGIAAARRRGRWSDRIIRLLSLITLSTPAFWLGLMASMVFANTLQWLPAGGMTSVGIESMGPFEALIDRLRHLVLPATVLGLANAARTMRYVRAQMIEILDQDYIRAARAKGLAEWRVLWIHGLRNALVPLVQLLGIRLPTLFNGVLLIEVIFSWPGLGRLTFDAMSSRDVPLVLATSALTGILIVTGTLAADLAHGLVDPRVRHAR